MTIKKEMVVKSNDLIQASYTLTLIEARLILLAIVEARESGLGISERKHLTIRAKTYADHFGVTPEAAYLALQEGAKTLFERKVTLYDQEPESGKSRKRLTRWVSEIAYVEDAAKLQLIFAPAVVPEITRLEASFTRYELEQVAKLTSAYAVRLYELVSQWRTLEETPLLELRAFRQQLGLLDSDYRAMCDFKKRVLDVAVDQINLNTDLQLTYEQIKSGRTIIGFKFQFRLIAPKKVKRTSVAPVQAVPQPWKLG